MAMAAPPYSRWLRCLGAAVAALAQIVPVAPAAAAEDFAVKAALVYNILRFVTVPGNPSRIRVCVLESDPIAPSLRKIDGRQIGQLRASVALVANVAGLKSGCDVIYLDDDSPKLVGGAVRGQVLIGSGSKFAEGGGTVGLINFGGQVRFVINARVANRSGVTISAQLMQLAAKVVS